jgi:hypothetical protein
MRSASVGVWSCEASYYVRAEHVKCHRALFWEKKPIANESTNNTIKVDHRDQML